MASTVPNKDLVITLPYLGKFSLQIFTRINHIMEKTNSVAVRNLVFKIKCKISNFFKFEDRISTLLHSAIVYKF